MLTNDQIIEIAKQEWSAGDLYIGPDIRSLTRFARLIEAATREECVWNCLDVEGMASDYGDVFAAAIRNSGGEK